MEPRNPYKRCIACGISVIGGLFLCCRCSRKFPNVVEQAARMVEREDRERLKEEKRILEIQGRRSSLRCI